MNDPNCNVIDAEGDSSTTDADMGNKLLEEFRQEWKKELKADEIAVFKTSDVANEPSQKIDEDKVIITNMSLLLYIEMKFILKKREFVNFRCRQNHSSLKPLNWKNWAKFSRP